MPQIDEPPRSDSAPARGFTMLISAAVAAVVAFAVSWASLDSHPGRGAYDASKDVAALTARVVAVQRDLDATGDKLAALRTRIAQSTDLTVASLGPDSRVAHLSALSPAPGADGVVAINRAVGTAILHARGLPPTPSDKTYEVWWIGSKQEVVKAGTFEPASDDATIVSLNLPPPGEVVQAGSVTLEPLGGLDKPTGATYLKGDFPRR